MLFSHKILRDRDQNGNNGNNEVEQVTLQVKRAFPGAGNEYGMEKDPEAKKDEIITRAREEAGKILEDTRHQAEKEAEQVKEQAYQEGYEQGYREALEKADSEAQEIRAQATRVLQQAEEEKNRTVDSLEDEIVALGVDIAEKIVEQQLTVDRETVLSIARQAIEMVKNRETLTIYINPGDRDVFESRRDELFNMLPAYSTVQFITDEKISPGGCVVETGQGRVDATVETRWEQVLESLDIKGDG